MTFLLRARALISFLSQFHCICVSVDGLDVEAVSHRIVFDQSNELCPHLAVFSPRVCCVQESQLRGASGTRQSERD